MAGKGGTALLIAIAIGVSLGLLDQSRSQTSTAAPTATAAPTTTSTSTATSSSTVVAASGSDAGPRPLANCPGRVVGRQTANDVTVRVSYDPQDGGTNCVSAAHNGPVTPPGYLEIEIRIADDTSHQWPRYASATGAPGAAEVSGAYLVHTDGECITASATYYPSGSGGGSVTSVSLSGIGCG